MKNGTSGDYIVIAAGIERDFGQGAETIHVLRGLDLSVKTGEMVALFGPSGSGKTTLLNLIGTLDSPTAGKILVRGQDVTAMSEGQRARFRRYSIGFIFQNYTLMSTYTASENVDLALRLLLPRIGYRERRERTAAALRAMGLTAWAGHIPDQLSGGQRQRVAIARALALRPALILADEPTSGLDTQTAKQVLSLFQGIARLQGTAFIIVSHDPTVVNYVDHTYDLYMGQLKPRIHENSQIGIKV